MKIAFVEMSQPRKGALAVFVMGGRQLLPTAEALDRDGGGALVRAMGASRFTGARGQMLEILAPAGSSASRLLLCGLGDGDSLDLRGLEMAAGEAARRLRTSGETQLTFACDPFPGDLPAAVAAAHIGFGARLGAYRFDRYHTKLPSDRQPSLATVAVAVDGVAGARRAYKRLQGLGDGILMVRDLVAEPGNVLNPAALAGHARSLEDFGVKVEILGEAAMRKLGMNALLGVGQGSANESQLAVMQWQGAGRDKPVALVGKGVTFDTGGISLKPGAGMEEMKWDMGGAATVIGLMRTLAARKAKVNVVGVVGLVENMPSGTAQRPGDVVTTMSGQTVEVINTDAEGRLVLADAMWFAQKRFKPQILIDLATLTGAMLVSLGYEYCGMFSNDDALAERLTAAARATGDQVWRMPLGEAYESALDSAIADMRNIGTDRYASAIVAAQFLQRFVDDTPWAHLDIAGTAWSNKDRPLAPKGATGWGVRLLDHFLAEHYERG